MSFRLLVAIALTVLAVSSPVAATISPVRYYRMGEDDGNTIAGASFFSTKEHSSTLTLVANGSTRPLYTDQTGSEAAARVASTCAVSLSGSDGFLADGTLLADTDNFGIEGWVKPLSSARSCNVIYNGTAGTNGCGVVQVGNTFQGLCGGVFFGSAPLAVNSWSHVAIVCSSGTTTLYVNGVNCGSTSAAQIGAKGMFQVGGAQYVPNEQLFYGLVDELRTFTFSSGAFSPSDFLRQASDIAIEQPVGTFFPDGAISDFGFNEPGTPIARSFTLRSRGVSDLSGISIIIGGVDSSSFSLTQALPATMATGSSTTFNVSFNPTTAGRKKAVVRIASNDPDQNPYDIYLTGSTAGPEIAVEQPAGTSLSSGIVSSWPINSVPEGLANATAVAGGFVHNLALRSDGTVIAWGSNTDGQVVVPSGLNASAIAAGQFHSVAVKTDGTVVAWGRSSSGQIAVPVGLTGVTAVAAGYLHTLALKSDGTVAAWGADSSGQVDVPSNLSGVSAVAAGARHSLALKSNGTVIGWGSNTASQATPPPGLSEVIAISAGFDHSLALLNDGTVRAWGGNSVGQSNVPSGLSGVVAIAAGEMASIALKSDGTLVSWGRSGVIPFTPPTGVRFISSNSPGLVWISDPAVAFGNQAALRPSSPKTVVIRSVGSLPLNLSAVTITGANASDFSVSSPSLPITLPAQSGESALHITFTPSAAGPRYAILNLFSNDPGKGRISLTLAGTGLPGSPEIAVFSGTGTSGPELSSQAGVQSLPDAAIGSTSSRTFTISNTGNAYLSDIQATLVGANPSDFALSGPGVTSLSPGSSASFTVTFHSGIAGPTTATIQINSNDKDEKKFEIPIAANGLAPEIEIEAQDGTPLKTGKLVYWGYPGFEPSDSLAGVSNIVSVAPAGGYVGFLRADGTVAVTGWSGFFPIPDGVRHVVAIAGIQSSILALKENGSLVLWDASSGDLKSLPAEVSSGIVAIAGGNGFLALKSDGSVLRWQPGFTTLASVPDGLSGVTAISSRGANFALKSDGTLTAWGDYSNPAQAIPAGLSGVSAIAAGSDFGMALKSNGSVVTWGATGNGSYIVPPGLTGVTAVAAGSSHRLALKNDGTVVGWGANQDNQAVPPPGLSGVRGISATDSGSFAIVDSVVSFGSIPTGSTSSVHRFTIRNTGSQPLHLGTIAASGGDHGDFVADATGVPATLPPFTGAASFTITFTPTASGFRQATLTVLNDDPDEHTYRIALNGSGIQAAPGISIEDSSGTPLGKRALTVLGSPNSQALNVPSGLGEVRAVAAAQESVVALKEDGTIATWGSYLNPQETPVPLGLTDVIAVTPNLALRSDGKVVAWGNQEYDAEVPADLSDVVAISSGFERYYGCYLALKSDGTVIAWHGAASLLAVPSGLSEVKAISVGGTFAMALKEDGTVITWGSFDERLTVPAGLSGVSAISAGYSHCLALKTDGTVVGWGISYYGEAEPPAGLSDVVAISAGSNFSLALKRDGTVVSWGLNNIGQSTVPFALSGVRSISAGVYCSAALVESHATFAPAVIGMVSAPRILTLRNTGLLPLHLNGLQVVGGNASDFILDTSVTLLTVPPGGSTTMAITFTPG